MDIYASDEEKGEEIKQWWRDNGRSVILGCVLGAVVIFAGRYWINYQNTQDTNASVVYQYVEKAISEGDLVLAEDKTQQLFNEFPNTAYAVFAAFEVASQSASNNDTASAQSYLEWIMASSKLVAHKELARLRLVQLLINDGKFERSLILISEAEGTAFSSLLAELRGDVFVAQGEPSLAIAEYENAISDLTQGQTRQQLLKIKLDDVAESNEG